MIFEHKINNENMNGSIKFDMPSFAERTKIAKEFSYSASPEGMKEASPFDSYEKMMEKTISICSDVDVVIDGEKVDNIELLLCYSDGKKEVEKIMHCLVNGVPLGKKSLIP